MFSGTKIPRRNKAANLRWHLKRKWSCYRVSGILLLLAWIGSVMAADSRTRPVRTEHEAFTPIREYADWDSWPKRIRQDLLLAAGLWPAPSKTPLQTWLGEPRIFDGYAVAGICFQSMPGHWVTTLSSLGRYGDRRSQERVWRGTLHVNSSAVRPRPRAAST
jgi:hypothetical protein